MADLPILEEVEQDFHQETVRMHLLMEVVVLVLLMQLAQQLILEALDLLG
jgi:hypothetical protein